MQPQIDDDKPTHNAFVHSMVASNKSTNVCLAKLDTHKFIYHLGRQHRYLMNLILVGRDFIQLYALFTGDLVLELGRNKLYEDVSGCWQWQKHIVVVSQKKVVGFIYEDCMLKNSFMISLEFLRLGAHERIELTPDRQGNYLAISTPRKLLLVLSHKMIQKHKAKPFNHKYMQVISEQIKWNRGGESMVAEVVEFDFYDCDFAAIRSLCFCDDRLYFLATINNGLKKNLQFIHTQAMFEENEETSIMFLVSIHTTDVEEVCIIPNGNQTEYLLITNSDVVEVHNQKGKQVLETFTSGLKIVSRRSHPIFPLALLNQNTLHIYHRQLDKHSLTLPPGVLAVDIRDNIILYSVGYEARVRIVGQNDVDICLERSFCNVVDFHLGSINMLLVDNLYGNTNKVYKIKRAIKSDQRPFAIHQKKKALEQMRDLVEIRSLPDHLLVRMKSASTFTLLQQKVEGFQPIQDNILWGTHANIHHKTCFLLWTQTALQLYHYQSSTLTHHNDIPIPYVQSAKIRIVSDWVVMSMGLKLSFYCLTQNKSFNLTLETEQQPLYMEMLLKQYTFKRKDKDYNFVEVVVVSAKVLQIWEVCLLMQKCKLTHRSENIGEGLCYMFAGADTRHKFKSITCPEYSIPNHTIVQENHILHSYVDSDGHLLLISSNQEIILYKKQYTSTHELGYVYRRKVLALGVVKGFRVNDGIVELGCGLVRVGNYFWWKGHLLEGIDQVRCVFEMEGSLWGLTYDAKLHKLQTEGHIVSGFLTVQVPTSLSQNIIAIESTNHYYVLYTPTAFEVLDMQLKPLWQSSPSEISTNEFIITVCVFQQYIAISYVNYCPQENNSEYQSIKFKLRIYNKITKAKIFQKEKTLQQPINQIRYLGNEKILLITPSNIFVYECKGGVMGKMLTKKNYSKRTFLRGFSLVNMNVRGNDVGYMVFGGTYGGLSFMTGQWMEDGEMKELWFENVQCEVSAVQMFNYPSDELFKLLLADEDGNLVILNLMPTKADKLADMYIGARVNTIKKRGQIPYLCCDDGSIKIVMGIKLKDIDVGYLDFQECFCKEIPLLGGFNTRDSRKLQQKYRTYKITSSANIVDCSLMEEFLALTQSLKVHVAEKSEIPYQQFKKMFANYLL